MSTTDARLPRAPGASRGWRTPLAAVAVTALALAIAAHGPSTKTLLLPVGLVVLVLLLLHPRAYLLLLVSLVVLCEGHTFGLFSFTAQLYDEIFKGLTPLDVLVTFAVVAVGIDLIRYRRPIQLPPVIGYPAALLVLAMIAGIVTGHANGQSLRAVVLGENTLGYLLFLPIAIVNLPLTRRQIELALWATFALAILKAVLGLVEIAGGYGEVVEGTAQLTYYEPTPNWLIMVAIFALLAALLARVRPPRWMLFGAPLLVASLLLSYRRSFWIAAALGLTLVVLLGLSPAGRRLIVPVGLLVAAAIWVLSAVGFQLANSPIVQRATSLNPTSLTTNLQDAYRLYERANVEAEIRREPITGLGIAVPWVASTRPLPIYNQNGQLYVHFAVLWYWLKLGILGAASYVAYIIAGLLLGWRVFRRSREPTLRAFGLASLCAVAGLIAIETTASFTGVDARFSALLGVQLGVLASLARSAPRPAARERPSVPPRASADAPRAAPAGRRASAVAAQQPANRGGVGALAGAVALQRTEVRLTRRRGAGRLLVVGLIDVEGAQALPVTGHHRRQGPLQRARRRRVGHARIETVVVIQAAAVVAGQPPLGHEQRDRVRRSVGLGGGDRLIHHRLPSGPVWMHRPPGHQRPEPRHGLEHVVHPLRPRTAGIADHEQADVRIDGRDRAGRRRGAQRVVLGARRVGAAGPRTRTHPTCRRTGSSGWSRCRTRCRSPPSTAHSGRCARPSRPGRTPPPTTPGR